MKRPAAPPLAYAKARSSAKNRRKPRRRRSLPEHFEPRQLLAVVGVNVDDGNLILTGDIDVHDMAVDADGRLVFVSTLTSCLATTSDRYNLQPLWKPPFISRLATEDRWQYPGALRRGRDAGSAATESVGIPYQRNSPSHFATRRGSGRRLARFDNEPIFKRRRRGEPKIDYPSLTRRTTKMRRR